MGNGCRAFELLDRGPIDMPIAAHRIRRPARLLAVASLWLALVALTAALPGAAYGQGGASPDARASEGARGGRSVYRVRRIELRYAGPAADLPPVGALRSTPVTLQRRGEAWHAPDGEGPTVTRPIDELADLAPHRFHGTALRAISLAIVGALNDRGYIGVTARPDPSQIGPDGRDRRAGSATMRFLINVARVARRRTLASGDRVDPERGINHPAHERIKTYSPLRRGEPVRPPHRNVNVSHIPAEGPWTAFFSPACPASSPATC